MKSTRSAHSLSQAQKIGTKFQICMQSYVWFKTLLGMLGWKGLSLATLSMIFPEDLELMEHKWESE